VQFLPEDGQIEKMRSEPFNAGIPDRVRESTDSKANEQIDRNTQACLQRFANASPEESTAHINELNREWDMERRLQANASILALSGVILGATVSKKWLVIPGIVFSFFLQHAIQGWCPPVPVFRRMGVRTAKEIDREKYALKALRGDFNSVERPGATE
jgi:hypothetical protein